VGRGINPGTVMRTPIVIFSIAAAVAGCTTTAQQAAYAESEVARMMQVYGPACGRLGFKADTDAWRNCIIGLAQRDAMNY